MNDPLLALILNNLPNYLWYLGYALFALMVFISLFAAVMFGKLWARKPLLCLWWVVVAGPASFVMKIIATVLAFPLSLISVVFNVDRLPAPLSWLHTHDMTLDAEYQTGWGRQRNFFLRFFWRAVWIMRNPGYGFMYDVLGIDVFPPVVDLNQINHYHITPQGDGGRSQYLADNAVSIRGRLGPIYYWLGWKLATNQSAGRAMLAYGMSLKV